MDKITLKFKQDKETKRTVRFAEQVKGDETPVVGSVYVQKSALGDKAPENLTVTLTAVGMNYSKYARHAYSRTKVRPRGGRRRARSAGSGSADVVYLHDQARAASRVPAVVRRFSQGGVEYDPSHGGKIPWHSAPWCSGEHASLSRS
jgi:hypothetical protein